MGTGKKKIGKILLTVAVSFVPFFIAMLVLTGLLSFFAFVGAIVDSPFESEITAADLAEYDIDKMISVVNNIDIITEDVLDQMMIERSTLLALLKEVKEYNNTYEEATKTIQKKHIYTNTSTYCDMYGNTYTVSTVHEEWVDCPLSVTTKDYEAPYHHLEWQSVYVAAVQETLQNMFGRTSAIASASEAPDAEKDMAAEEEQTVTGQQVAEYAESFVGLEYKVNGQSLKKGVDNSGFVMKIYEHFDLELSHNAYIQQNSGSLVVRSVYKEDLMQPGDLIFYNGFTLNVGIYIGDGNMVLANSKEGVCIKRVDEILESYTFQQARRFFDAEGTVGSLSTQENVWGAYVGNYSPETKDAKKAIRKYETYLKDASEVYGIPEDLIKAVIEHENRNWEPELTASGSSATGLGQITEATCVDLGFRLSDRTDPEKSIKMVAKLLAKLKKEFKGDAVLSIAAYYQGISGIHKYVDNGQDLPEYVYEYVADVLSRYTGQSVTIHNCQASVGDNLMDTSLGYGSISERGRIYLSEAQIEALIDDFKTDYTYEFDVVRDSQTYYTFDECASLPNYGQQQTGDPSTAEGQYIWYEPVSSLSLVEHRYMDVIYQGINELSDIVIRLDRWETLFRFYWYHYKENWCESLIDVLPRGFDAIDTYQYYASIASQTILYDGDIAMSLGGVSGGTGVASGNYIPLDGVQPSIKIPTDCGGMSIPLYLQTDSRWGSVPYGTGNPQYKNTISRKGCGPTAMAMVMSYLKEQCIYPDDIVEIIGNQYYVEGAGTSYAMFQAVASLFHCYVVQQTVDADAIVTALQEGHPVIVSTSGYGTNQEFTSGGHFIVLRGLDDNGMVLVNDPNDKAGSKNHFKKSYSAQYIVNECKAYGTKKPMFIIYKRN